MHYLPYSFFFSSNARRKRGEYKSASHLRAKEESLKREGEVRERRHPGKLQTWRSKRAGRWRGRLILLLLLLLFCCFSTRRKEMSEQTRASRHPEPANFYSYFMAINFFAVTLKHPSSLLYIPLVLILFLHSSSFSPRKLIPTISRASV